MKFKKMLSQRQSKNSLIPAQIFLTRSNSIQCRLGHALLLFAVALALAWLPLAASEASEASVQQLDTAAQNLAAAESSDDKTDARDALAEIAMPPEMESRAQAYQACVSTVMGEADKKVAWKREQLAEQCRSTQDHLIALFPEDMREFARMNTQRELERVLNALEQVEDLIVSTATDANEISEELSALEAEAKLAELDAQAEAMESNSAASDQGSLSEDGLAPSDDSDDNPST